MSLRINTNVEAFNAHRNLSSTEGKLAMSMERLSSGYRINRAADDAAGLAISERLKAQIGGLGQAQRNAQDAVSLVQTAEGSLDQVHAMLGRIRDLAVEFKNGTLSVSIGRWLMTYEATLNSDGTEFNGRLKQKYFDLPLILK